MTDAEETAIVAVGAGPANLSLAALAEPIEGLRAIVLECKPKIDWHPGLLIDDARLQTHALKDLVTMVDPTSALSFLAYLKERGLIYAALVRGLDCISRAEFTDYLRWAGNRVGDVRLGTAVEEVDVRDGLLEVSTSAGPLHTRHLVVGTGRVPRVPGFAKPWLGPDVFHACDFLREPRRFAGRRVAIVGGGQSGAEIILDLLRRRAVAPASITWVARRANLFALEDSPFVNEWFFPDHNEWFARQEGGRRERLLEKQLLASDGISLHTLEAIYERVYRRRAGLAEEYGLPVPRILPETAVTGMYRGDAGYRLELDRPGQAKAAGLYADCVVLATGFRSEVPECLERLRDRIAIKGAASGDEEIEVGFEFSTGIEGAPGCRLFVQNGARSQHGISDPNLSLVAMRSARILNAICGRKVYECDAECGGMDWDCRTGSEQDRPVPAPHENRSTGEEHVA